MQPYGLNGSDAVRSMEYNEPDVADIQDALPKGFRIRKKKQKRRNERKRTRMMHKQRLIPELQKEYQ